MRLREATRADLPRIMEVRHGTRENRLLDPSRVTEKEVLWYLDEGVFLVSEDEDGVVQGFTCANPQTGLVWALFVIDEAHGRGHGTALLLRALDKLRNAGCWQAHLSTGPGTLAHRFYKARGWEEVGLDMDGGVVFRLGL